MGDSEERGAEGGEKIQFVLEGTTEGEEPEVLGEFCLVEFLGELEDIPCIDDVSALDDLGEGAIDDASASSADPSGTEWKKELELPEFVLKTNDEMRDFVESTRNPNTVRKTNQVVKSFQKWLATACDEERKIEEIEPEELDNFIANYMLTKKKKTGENHQADTLTSIHRAILRHLKHNNYPVDPMFDEKFEMSRDVLSSRRQKLKQEGFGNRPNKAESFDQEEIEKMWSCGALGTSTPEILQHTVYWYLTMGFGLRGCDESRNMKWGDVKLLQDKDGQHYLEWVERSSKTRQGGEGGHTRAFAPKIYSTTTERCPVAMYRAFRARRPEKCMKSDSPFYLTVRQGATMKDTVAYINAPMGVNKLRSVVKSICEKAGLPGRHTNHSIRKTSCQTLMSNNVPPVLVAQLSGHKNIQSLNNYTVSTRPQQKAMSDILTGNSVEKLTSLPCPPAKRMSIVEEVPPVPAKRPVVVEDTTTHGDMVLPPAPVAVSLPWAHPLYTPVSAVNNPVQRANENMAGLLSGAHVSGPINIHINYNMHSNSQANVNVSPQVHSAGIHD